MVITDTDFLLPFCDRFSINFNGVNELSFETHSHTHFFIDASFVEEILFTDSVLKFLCFPKTFFYSNVVRVVFSNWS